MLQFEEVDEKTWETLTPPAKPKESKWDPLLQELEEGKIIQVPFDDDKEKRGYRIGIGRTAKYRGYKVEFREHDGFLAMRKTELPPEKPKREPGPAGTRQRGRPKKNQEEE